MIRTPNKWNIEKKQVEPFIEIRRGSDDVANFQSYNSGVDFGTLLNGNNRNSQITLFLAKNRGDLQLFGNKHKAGRYGKLGATNPFYNQNIDSVSIPFPKAIFTFPLKGIC